jgi:hypothetical protein
MIRRICVSLACTIGIVSLVITTNGQCSDELPNNATLEKKHEFVKKSEADITKEKDYTHVLATLTENATFKVALDGDMTSGFSKADDYVTFTVLEDVYGRGHIYDPDNKVDVYKRCAVIPKGTKIYGVVDHANSRYPFSIGGKAKLFVTVRELKLDNGVNNSGVKVSIRFANPKRTPKPGDTNTHKKATRECKHSPGPCIVGRREKLKISASQIGAGAAAGLLIIQNNNSDEPNDAIGGVAALTFLDALSKSTGIDDLVNPPNALLKEKMIFDIETTEISSSNPVEVWVAVAPKAEEKAAAGQEKKP